MQNWKKEINLENKHVITVKLRKFSYAVCYIAQLYY